MTWSGRLRTAITMIQLIMAVAMVRFVPMRAWRHHLGAMAGPQTTSICEANDAQRKQARRCAWHVTRGASFFPFTVKCLPQAMVLQWQLRRRGIASKLVIAMLKAGRSAAQDPYHAWIEMDGIMILGNCERSDYAVLMILTNQRA